MATDDAFGSLFKTAPKPVVDYFDRRPNRPTFSWRDIAPREHAIAFTVAKSAGFDILDDVRAATRRAVVDRIPFEEFRASLEPMLRAKGWWGQKRVVDPQTGEIVRAQLGSHARLKLIYDANIRSARAAGDWSRIQANKEVLPYLEYLRSTSEQLRPLHLTWVGTTLPVDDVWWKTHFPPNGWRCKCRVSQRAEPRDKTPPEKLKRPPSDLQPWTNRRSGETQMVPAGVDPGWQHNLGMERERLVGQQLVARLDAMAVAPRRNAIAQMRREPMHRYVVNNEAGFDHTRRFEPDQQSLGRMRWPVATVPERLATRLGVKTRVATVSLADAAKIVVKHPEVAKARVWSRIDDILAQPDLVVGPGKAKAKVELLKEIDGVWWKAVLKTTALGEVFVNSLYRINRDEQIARARRRAEETDRED